MYASTLAVVSACAEQEIPPDGAGALLLKPTSRHEDPEGAFLMSFFVRKLGKSASMRRTRLTVEQLDDRVVPAVSASFNSGVLTVLGDAAANTIRVGAAADGRLVVTEQGNAVRIRTLNGQALLAQTTLIVIDGKAGDDDLQTDASLNTLTNGSLSAAPSLTMLGGGGNDTLKVGHGGIVGGLAGVDADGVVVGPVVGNAFMDGGAGNDTLVSGFGNDTMLGSGGDDTYLWPPGTLTDIWDGGAGNDTAIIIGNDTFLGPDPAGDSFQLTANGSDVLFQRVNLVQFSVDIARTENVVMRPGAGDDVVNIGDLTGVANLRQVTVEGGAGNDFIDGSAQLNGRISLVLEGGADNDVLLGGAGKDILRGGDGCDNLDGGRGEDVLAGGNGYDTLDGGNDRVQDVVLGGSGGDTFVNRVRDVFEDFWADEGDVFELS